MNPTIHADGTRGGTPVAPPTITAPPAAVDDLDALIAAAELRVLQRDRRVLRHGEQLKQRLASHGTQARLGALGVAGVAAIVLLSRQRRAKGGTAPSRERETTAKRTPAATWWVVWLPVLLQLFTAGSARPARPPGMAGVASMLVSVARQWAGRQSTRPRSPSRDGRG